MNSKKIILIILFLMSITLGGCWDRRELESLGLVQTLGLDLGPDGKGVTITTAIAIPPNLKAGGEGGGGGGGHETGVLVLSMDAPSIYEGFNLINTTVNREVTLLQNSTLLLGEEIAKKGIRKWIDNLVRFREMRRTLLIFVCQGKAAEFMNIKSRLEKNPGEYFVDLDRLSKRTGMFPTTSLNEFMVRYEAFAQENYTPLLAKYQRQEPEAEPSGSNGEKTEDTKGEGGGQQKEDSGGKKPEPKDARMIGTAIFRGDKMVGHFDIYETQVLQLITNKFREGLLTTFDPIRKGNIIAFRLLATAPPNIKYQRENGVDNFWLKLKLEADIISIQSGIDYTTPQKELLLGKHIAKELKHRIDKTIKKAQQQYESDVFGFGVKVKNTFLTAAEWDKYHWPEKFKDAKIHTQVKVDLRRVGVQFQPPVPR